MFLFKLLSFNHFCLKIVCNTRFPKMFWNFDFQICFGLSLSLMIPTSLAVLHLLPRGSLNPHPEPGLIGCIEANAPWWYWDIKDPVTEVADLSFYLLQLLIFVFYRLFLSLLHARHLFVPVFEIYLCFWHLGIFSFFFKHWLAFQRKVRWPST